ncbi:DNA-binding transcriptional LysR family regulator [Variovorax boronicumulans]|uniref:LysR substrate-binding domain-containing protein n=1 Tax=Variovorax boronicumulans TaxID=436515 RepID=UPI002789118B|nr:LysR substrate-binding domain-containing protein [Variovorax boronicumulans]MDQ0035954.1 DNA-binding transcriptional LysR family regulator [Variovorax boronicumulans]
MIAGRLRAQGVAPETVQTLSHTHSILALVDAGVGVALVPRSAQKLGYAGVRFSPLDETDSFDVEVHLAWRRRGRQGVVDAVRLLIQEAYPVPDKA